MQVAINSVALFICILLSAKKDKMSGYGIRTRFEREDGVQNSHVTTQDTWVRDPISFISRSEETMSYRTGSSVGKPVLDHVADPHAYFLRNSVDNKHEAAVKQYGKQTRSGAKAVMKPHTDNGHPFWTTKRWIRTDRTRRDYSWTNKGGPTYNIENVGGPFFAVDSQVKADQLRRLLFNMHPSSPGRFAPASVHKGLTNPNYYAQKAISKIAPNRPDFNLPAFLGELREGLPSFMGIALLTKRAEGLKDLGKGVSNEILNHQFGIVPLVSDIISIFKTLSRVSEILLQNEKDAGNGVRRRMDFKWKEELAVFTPSDLDSQGLVATNPYIINPGPTLDWPSRALLFSDATFESTLTQTVTERVSFAGSFTTYLPVGQSFAERTERYMKLGQRLFGVGLTPATLWQLTPWSWLADWLFDIESTLSAQERMADDSLVMNYGYVMSHSIYRATQSTVVRPNPGSFSLPFSSVSTTAVSEKKERLRANPYGFAASDVQGLDPRQWTILAALGITRM